MAAITRRSIASFGEKLQKLSAKLVLPEKLRGGYIEKGVKYLEVVAQDYKTALQDGLNDARARPLKASVYTGVGLLTAVSVATNPTERDYESQRTYWSNELAIVAKTIRNTKAEEYLKRVNRLLNQDRLERYNLLMFSLMVRNDFSPECQTYAAQCSFSQPTIFEVLGGRVIDVGFFGRWWAIDRHMTDYDVNEEEFLLRD